MLEILFVKYPRVVATTWDFGSVGWNMNLRENKAKDRSVCADGCKR